MITGPCSAESYEQLDIIAKKLIDLNIKRCLFRAGIWKPRTKPGGFEGVGEMGIKWMVKIRDIYGFQIGWEVATDEHIDISLKYNPDFLWIGARTTGNPFMMDAIGKKLANTNIQIFVKNPTNADYDLWEGSVKRLLQYNVNVVGLIHRGFSSNKISNYRNSPEWNIPMKMMCTFPHLQMIGDPSHLVGDRNLISEVSKKMMKLDYDGLMIETHYEPERAFTDAKQQITPIELKKMLYTMYISDNTDNSLGLYRLEIDDIDNEIIALLKKRFDITAKVGKYKKDNNISVFQPDRFAELLNTRELKAHEYGLPLNLATDIFNIIHERSAEQQFSV